ncbi:hypothetical protein [Hymenobacter lapidiphilus]|uniref:hypothetical protein n=1 Tax=Hymenobacter sp. CCM 8763 TaxID=2303334 RepID=UPI0011C11A01|nr:hypothetical protein [Hymenobacter sp. CCM 8763]
MIRRSFWFMLPIGCLLGAFQSSNEAFMQLLKGEVARFYQITAPEKAYLHLDKDSYTAGETIWFEGYVVSAGQHRTTNVLS